MEKLVDQYKHGKGYALDLTWLHDFIALQPGPLCLMYLVSE